MELIGLGAGPEKVWINPAQIAWFWNSNGSLAIRFVGGTEMEQFPGTTAEQFAKMLESSPPC